MKTSDLHPNERGAGEEEVIINGQRKGYAPLYPLPAIIALSFLLDSTEAHLFRKYISRRLQTEAAIVTPICLLGNTKNWWIYFLFLSPIISYYITTIRVKAVKEKGLTCSREIAILITTKCLHTTSMT